MAVGELDIVQVIEPWERSFKENVEVIMRNAAWALVEVETAFVGGNVGEKMDLTNAIDSLASVLHEAEWLAAELTRLDGNPLSPEHHAAYQYPRGAQ